MATSRPGRASSPSPPSTLAGATPVRGLCDPGRSGSCRQAGKALGRQTTHRLAAGRHARLQVPHGSLRASGAGTMWGQHEGPVRRAARRPVAPGRGLTARSGQGFLLAAVLPFCGRSSGASGAGSRTTSPPGGANSAPTGRPQGTPLAASGPPRWRRRPRFWFSVTAVRAVPGCWPCRASPAAARHHSRPERHPIGSK